MYGWLTRQLSPTRIAHALWEGEPGGSNGSGGDAGSTSGTASGGAAAAGSSAAPGTGDVSTGSGDGQPGPVPYARFQEVNAELQRRKTADADRERKDLEAKGEHEKLARTEREGREIAEAKALRIGRRAAFVSAAAGKVADVNAAATLAIADGMLEGIELDDDGNVTKGDTGKLIDKVLERYPFLKAAAANRATGAPLGGAGANPQDAEKMTPDERLRAGVAESMRALPAARQGVTSGR